MAKALIVYASRTKRTIKLAELIAEGMRFSGVDVSIANVNDIKKIEDLSGYDAYVFGSATYHGEMISSMKTFLFLSENADLENKAGGSFGSFGWSGEAPERIFDTMKNIFKMDMVNSPLMLKSHIVEGAVKVAQDYGREIAKKIS